MAQSSKFRGWRGMTRLRRILGRMPPESSKEVKELVADFAKDIETTAKQSARTGSMASRRYSQAITTKISRAGFSAQIGRVGEKSEKLAWFGHFIEYGTKAGLRKWGGKTNRAMRRRTGSFQHPGTPARPVLLPAFERHRPKFQPRIRDAIDHALRRVAAGASDD